MFFFASPPVPKFWSLFIVVLWATAEDRKDLEWRREEEGKEGGRERLGEGIFLILFFLPLPGVALDVSDPCRQHLEGHCPGPPPNPQALIFSLEFFKIGFLLTHILGRAVFFQVQPGDSSAGFRSANKDK